MVLYDHGVNGNVYHLGNPYEESTIRDLALDIADWFGRRIEVVPGKLPKGSPTRRLPDIRKLGALGYEPRVQLKRGLSETLAWYALPEREVTA